MRCLASLPLLARHAPALQPRPAAVLSQQHIQRAFASSRRARAHDRGRVHKTRASVSDTSSESYSTLLWYPPFAFLFAVAFGDKEARLALVNDANEVLAKNPLASKRPDAPVISSVNAVDSEEIQSVERNAAAEN